MPPHNTKMTHVTSESKDGEHNIMALSHACMGSYSIEISTKA